MQFSKYHALGNDYIVVDPATAPGNLCADGDFVRGLCARNFGVGSDGILWGPLPAEFAAGLRPQTGEFALRIYNPDGSEAEKSGNGLRIFARYLFDRGLVRADTDFRVCTPGGTVSCRVFAGARQVRVEMGRVSFASNAIPMTGPAREVLREELEFCGRRLTCSAANIGNPHCVVHSGAISLDEVKQLGAAIEVDQRFPQRTNVQFLEVLDRKNIRIEIWERGAGYTLASGSSSSACAAVAVRLGLCDPDLTVHMPGGRLAISVAKDFAVTLTGPVTAVASGTYSPEIFAPAP